MNVFGNIRREFRVGIKDDQFGQESLVQFKRNHNIAEECGHIIFKEN